MESRHSAITMVVLVVLCLFGLFFGVQALTQPLPDGPLVANPSSNCSPRVVNEGERITRADVLVSVFNATNEGGLARETLSQLSQRGFGSGSDGNVEADVKYAQIWANEEHDPAALLVLQQFGPRARLKVGQDTTIGPGVVVVVGEQFERLSPGPRSVRAPYDTEVCSPLA